MYRYRRSLIMASLLQSPGRPVVDRIPPHLGFRDTQQSNGLVQPFIFPFDLLYIFALEVCYGSLGTPKTLFGYSSVQNKYGVMDTLPGHCHCRFLTRSIVSIMALSIDDVLKHNFFHSFQQGCEDGSRGEHHHD